MDVKRYLTGILGLPITILILVFSNTYFFDAIVAVVALIMIDEFLKSFKNGEKANPIFWISYLSCIYIAVLHIIPKEYIESTLIIGIAIIICILFFISIITKIKISIMDISVTMFGILYIILFLSFISKLRGIENGTLLVWYIFLISWGSDVLAYIIGKHFGKHKFSEISPKKTIEGCISGLIGSIIFALAYTLIINKYFDMNINYILMIGISAILGILSQIGDFAASTIKRYTKIKDYGILLPGHGGMLDRFDSVIFVAPFAYILLMML